MAKFTYNPNETMATTNEGSQNYPKVEFLSKYLKNDGDSVIVRFPYASINDFDVYHCHRVQLPGYQYAQNVMCARVDLKKEPASVCPICSSGDQVSSRVNDRFIVKAVAYIADANNQVQLVPVVWDKPKFYANELANKLADYGDLSQHLFKIRRNGTGTQTVYTTEVVINKQVYPDSIYVNDLSCLEHITDPGRLCIRPLSKYLEAMGIHQEPMKQEFAQFAPTSPTTPMVSVQETHQAECLVDLPPMPQVHNGNASENPFVVQQPQVQQEQPRANRFRTF